VNACANQSTRWTPDQGLYGRYHQWIYHYVRRRIADSDRARDFAQEACLRLLRMQQPAKVVQTPRAYGYQVAANLLHDHWLNERRAAVVFDSRLAEKCAEFFVGAVNDPEKIVEVEQRVAWVKSLLPALEAEILMRRKGEGASLREIASQLGLSVHTVKKYLFRAVERCRAEGSNL
jgi:RNA polymerase sigma-19 factor, ECF subfamily